MDHVDRDSADTDIFCAHRDIAAIPRHDRIKCLLEGRPNVNGGHTLVGGRPGERGLEERYIDRKQRQTLDGSIAPKEVRNELVGRTCKQLTRSPELFENAPRVQNGNAITDEDCLVDVVSDKDDRLVEA